MKRSTLTAIGAALLLLGGAGYVFWPQISGDKEAMPAAPTQVGSYIAADLTGEDWAKPTELAKRLDAELDKALPKVDGKALRSFLEKPENRLLIARRMLLLANDRAAQAAEPGLTKAREERDKLTKQKADFAKSPEAAKMTADQRKARLAEFDLDIKAQEKLLAADDTLEAASARGKCAGVMQLLGNNLDWMEQVCFSGELAKPGRVVSFITDIAKNHPGYAADAMTRDIITATALEYVRYGWLRHKAITRSDFFIRSYRADRLNTVFDTLPFWQRRMICGAKGDNNFGEVETLEWCQKHVHLPAEQYTDCWWRCDYKLFNPYAQSIHGDGYWQPFAGLYGLNNAKFTYEIGGVCGSLSHFGAFSAIANGVPALTAGEPGHCAFVVRVNDKWVPSYSVSWKRGLHWQVWDKVHRFTSLHAATDLFSAEQREATRLSNAFWTLALRETARNNKDMALKLYRAAAKTQPLNFAVWRDYANFLSSTAAGAPGKWSDLNELICEKLTPLYPEVAAELLRLHVYTGLDGSGLSDADLRKAILGFWKQVKGMGPDRWPIEDLLNDQLKMVTKGNAKDEKATVRFYGELLKLTGGSPEYAPVVLAWANDIGEKGSEDLRRNLMKVCVSSLAASGGDDESREKIISQAIVGAEKMRDIQTFQGLAKLLPEKYRKPRPGDDLPKHAPMPGKVLSKGGVVFISSTNKWNNYCSHWGLLEPEIGGHFHTDKAPRTESWIAIRLPRTGNVTGVRVVATKDQRQRMTALKVQTSESGRDDDWKDAGTLGDFTKDRVQTLDTSAARPSANYVRILNTKKNEFLHLNSIVVYGDYAS